MIIGVLVGKYKIGPMMHNKIFFLFHNIALIAILGGINMNFIVSAKILI
jgi:hypothetical protein